MSTVISITREEFNAFHHIDRLLFSILVLSLGRDPVESMQIMALWIWLERIGFGFIVDKMLSLPLTLVNELADEAVICLACINHNLGSISSENFDIPLLQSLLEEDISLYFFLKAQLSAIQGMAKVMNEVCIRALSDIMQYAINRNAAQSLADVSPMGFSQTRDAPPQRQNQTQSVPADDRTMFVTFSKGYPVLEAQVRNFFQNAYGDCIETLHMQEIQQPNQQSLYARIIFRSPSTIQRILNGRRTVKFSIQGRHVWARKFVPKRPRSLLASAAQG